jgi:dehydrogenase/reductase SDR family protein 4
MSPVLVLQRYGRLDILVSNAAVNPTAGLLMDISEDSIDKILNINIKAALLLVQAAVPHMTQGGTIVLISSVTGYK